MGKIKGFLKNLSLRRAFILYVTIFLFAAIILSALVISAFDAMIDNIYVPYRGVSSSYTLYDAQGAPVAIDYFVPTALDPLDARRVAALQSLRAFSVPFISVCCIISVAALFYRNKLAEPIALLENAALELCDGNLDFAISYQNRDELGRLCLSFEKMRRALKERNRELLRQGEERRFINAAFSHDLRTPLTVLRGNAEMLLVAGGNEKVMQTAQTMTQRISEIEVYVNAMSTLQKLDDLEVAHAPLAPAKLVAKLKETANAICGKLELFFESTLGDDALDASEHIIFEVYGNLLSNALRFGTGRITVGISKTQHSLLLTVADDGAGFSAAALERGAEPFFKGSRQAGSVHFGIGLTICKILCEKHNGSLAFYNLPSGGGCVTASFELF